MAIGVDTSKWKPRKIVGTPAARLGNIIGVGVLVVGVACGIIFHTVNVTKNIRKATEGLYEDPIKEVERRMMIASGLPTLSSEEVRKMQEDSKRIDRPDA